MEEVDGYIPLKDISFKIKIHIALKAQRCHYNKKDPWNGGKYFSSVNC